MDPLVRSLWAATAGSSARAAAVLESLVSRYAEPHRHYHGTRHLRRVVEDTDRLGRAVGLGPRRVVLAAAFFHDAVYDPTSATNEADSARLASSELGTLGWSGADLGEVERLVLATATHDATDPAAAVLLDADLAVLGATPPVYEAYVRGVRAEYAHVDDRAWTLGRAAVLRRFLDRERIFRTDPCHHLEPRARANLVAELATLTRPPAQ